MVARPAARPQSRPALTLVLLTGAGVAVAVGVYARVHSPAARPLFLLGFTGMLQLKSWFATATPAPVSRASASAGRLCGRAAGLATMALSSSGRARDEGRS